MEFNLDGIYQKYLTETEALVCVEIGCDQKGQVGTLLDIVKHASIHCEKLMLSHPSYEDFTALGTREQVRHLKAILRI